MTTSTKTALVTGASSGIGRVIAEQFAKDGINLVITARSVDQLDSDALVWREQYGIQVTVLGSDLAQIGAAQALADQVHSLNIEIDYLVNNAGFGYFGLFASSALEAEISMMRLNMEALTVLTKRFLPQITARQGKILNVASTAAFQPGPFMAVYYATKAYVLSFSEALAAELEGSGVTVTTLCPGPTASGFQDKAALHDSAMVKGKRLPTSEQVGVAGYRAMQRGERIYIPGLLNRLMAYSVGLMPRRAVTSMVKMMTRPV